MKKKIFWIAGIIFVVAVSAIYAAMINSDTYHEHRKIKIYTFHLTISNVHMVETDGKQILIDACLPGKEEEIINKLNQVGYTPEDIDLIILTHGHADHAGGASYFQRTYNIPVIAGMGDSAMLADGHNDTLVTHTFLDRMVRKYIATEDQFPALTPDILVEDTLDLKKFGIKGRITVLPVHTPGSLLITFGDAAFVGDLFRGAMLAPKRPRQHFFQPDLKKVNRALAQLLAEPYTTFFVGHGGPVDADMLNTWHK
jgi:glyoxylase-like metal-dependent hydrolase (beta-lactamase superfamily II)